MADKTLRILIADTRHFHRMKIERMFNTLDYYRIAPVQNFIELLSLIDFGCEPFDVLVTDSQLAGGMPDLHGFLFDLAQVRHALVYGEALNSSAVPGYFRAKITTCNEALPSMSAISQLMTSVDASRERSLCMCPAKSLA
ncbi:chemotaxis protein CheY [Pseudomonas kribbensis]|uniref:Chemotaxis protein CheY n=1 Tax=Pseudomonas kribbensis TaxID=1628086 RepID=A0A4Y8VMD9_9PSED|nr:chemotaxis protein CheY [Pseudomonas kribbensis]TFH81699.1 chemotaxis protein CheY [Pseudomonas kribbensis]